GQRVDGRRLDEPRKVSVARTFVKTAEGSARVKLGNTDVLIGIKMTVGEPYPDTPNTGVLSTSVELIPMASPTFEAGPPRPDAIELARVVDRGIRESKMVNMEKLCITPKEKVWIMFIDIHVLDYDGNLFDACSYGAVAALASTVVPAKNLGLGEDFALPIEHWPVSVTTAKIKHHLVVDPHRDEEGLKHRHVCPRCAAVAVRRSSTGVWTCRRCGYVFAGGAYRPIVTTSFKREVQETADKPEAKAGEA